MLRQAMCVRRNHKKMLFVHVPEITTYHLSSAKQEPPPGKTLGERVQEMQVGAAMSGRAPKSDQNREFSRRPWCERRGARGGELACSTPSLACSRRPPPRDDTRGARPAAARRSSSFDESVLSMRRHD